MAREVPASLMQRLYVLDDQGEVQPAPSFEAWCDSRRDDAQLRVAVDRVGDRLLSTVFLGFDQRYPAVASAPLVFETMLIIGPDNYRLMGRHVTKAHALAAHRELLAELRAKGSVDA